MSDSITQAAEHLRRDPASFFGNSITRMHTIPREELAALQLEAANQCFAEKRQTIEMVGKQAARVGLSSITHVDDLVPMLFAHSMYKSYPSSLLDKKRFDLLTRWLRKLTPFDLSHVDVAGCDSIDEWIDRMDAQTPLELFTSSGISGTLSIIPKAKAENIRAMERLRLVFFQRFGTEPRPEDIAPAVDVIWPNHASGKLGHLRLAGLLKRHYTGNDPNRFHALYSDAVSTDLMFLASKLQRAAARGELDRIEVDPKLLARKHEFEALQRRKPEEMKAFFKRMTTELRGRRVFIYGSSFPPLVDLATEGLARGIENCFAPDSVCACSGGTKGVALPDDWEAQVKRFLGVRELKIGYGMSEISALNMLCEHGRYHVPPWAIPFVLDPDTNAPLPRIGVQRGRAGFFDFTTVGHWGGTISGDEVEIDWDTPCPCGQTSVHLADDIGRFSDRRGGDDKITCAATAEAHDDAVKFLTEFQG
jgi:hypothetical protein